MGALHDEALAAVCQTIMAGGVQRRLCGRKLIMTVAPMVTQRTARAAERMAWSRAFQPLILGDISAEDALAALESRGVQPADARQLVEVLPDHVFNARIWLLH